MRKFIIAGFVFVLLGGAGAIGYNYVYHGHRSIERQDADYRLAVAPLEQKFLTDARAANIQYANKVIEVTGKVTAADTVAHVLTIDEKLLAECSLVPLPHTGTVVRIKGRFVGYDDLLGELRMDQATILK